MKKNKNKSITLYAIHIPAIAIAAFVIAGGFVATRTVLNQDQDQGSVLSKISNKGKGPDKNVEKGNSSKGKNNDKGGGKPNFVTSSGRGNSQKAPKGLVGKEYKGKSKNVAEKLKQVAAEEETAGNTEVSDELEDAAEEIEAEAEEVEEAVDNVEKRPRWMSVLIGSDYKNLGQLRSTLVRNRNTIRKLNRNVGNTAGESNDDALKEQLQTMVQERNRVIQFISDYESEFSVLGWVSRLLTGYEPIVEEVEEENDLVKEVVDVIGEEVDETTPSEDGVDESTSSN